MPTKKNREYRIANFFSIFHWYTFDLWFYYTKNASTFINMNSMRFALLSMHIPKGTFGYFAIRRSKNPECSYRHQFPHDTARYIHTDDS